MSKTADCDYHLGTAGMNFVCQDPCTSCFKPLLSLSQSDSRWLSLTDSLQHPWGEIRIEAPTKQPAMLERNADCPFWILFFHWRSWRLKGHLSTWYSASLGQGQCGQCVAASLTLLIPSVLVSVVQRDAPALPPCSRILSVVSCS